MKRLELLDYGRLFAALMVVLFHYTFNGINNGKVYTIDFIPHLSEITKYGYLGVELFFMISGYVIFYSAKNRTAAKFASSRVTRLYPAYWFAVIFTSIFAYFLGGSMMSTNLSTVLVNLTMLQSLLGVENVDGVYWTLIFELKFYLLIFALLFIGLQKYLEKIIVAWGVIITLSYFLGLESHVYLGGFYGYFVSGALFAILKERFTLFRFAVLTALYVISTIYIVNRAELPGEATGTGNSAIVISIVITLFYLFFFLQNTKLSENLKLKGSKLAGALTYPIYLIHAHFGYMMLNKFATNDNKIVAYIIIITSVFIIAALMHFIIEKRLSFIWKYLFSMFIEKPVTQLQYYFDAVRDSLFRKKKIA
ncbi:acyltransferase [Serratia sp. root2]|uniref:acyltransferase family protein n=1 Tax=Serratia sp. root2 TaxID=3059676 RepID=UPI0028919590|nr:acyltransferase [Serratia sp. root2]MDT3251092.1 acyltransferase [Serratia sp. root2]